MTSDIPVRRAIVNTSGMRRTKPTWKNTGIPTMKATNMIAQCTRRSPKRSMRVVAMRVAAPDSAIIFPSMVPSPTTMAMKPSVPPTPSWNALTAAAKRHPGRHTQTQRDGNQRDERVQLEARDEHDERAHRDEGEQQQTGVGGLTRGPRERRQISNLVIRMSHTHALSSGDGSSSVASWLSREMVA